MPFNPMPTVPIDLSVHVSKYGQSSQDTVPALARTQTPRHAGIQVPIASTRARPPCPHVPTAVRDHNCLLAASDLAPRVLTA